MPGTATIVLIDGTPTDYSDPWIDSLVAGGAWTDGDGGKVTIQWTAFQGTMDGHNSYGWTSLALAGLREALSLWEAVANIDFVEVKGAANADVRFWWGTESQADGALGWSDLPGFPAYYENPASETRDILFNAEDSSMYGALYGGLGDGGLGLVTMVHEIGHLLGLAHPHDGGAGDDATLFPGVDWWDPYATGDGGLNQGLYTAMSYNFGAYGSTSEDYGLSYGPMALDIAAIQSIYGANTTYSAGNTVYRLPTDNVIGTYWKSIWDTGGVDTISGAGATGSVTIDLRPATEGIGGGGWLSSATDYFDLAIQGGFTIARGVVIENAIGSDGFDTLIGNAAINRLEGGKGWDSLDGGAGADIMIGGEGNDTYYVDDAGDVVGGELHTVPYEFGFETDTVYSTAANYTLSANVENLTLQGIASINGKGNSSGNVITGNAGDNILESGGNERDGFTEFLYGVGSTDFLYGLGGNDRLVLTDLVNYMADGGTGTDTLALGGAGQVLDIASKSVASRLTSIERVDITGTGDNVLVVNQASVLGGIGAAVGSKYVLVVEGNAGDQLHFLESNWTKTGSLSYPEGTFDRWEFGNAQVHVKQGLPVQMPHSSAVTVLSSLDGSNGFKLSGGSTDVWIGCSVASAGDVNGDGFDDVIIGSTGPNVGTYAAGASYVVFGKASGFAANIDLPALNGMDGFKVSGVAERDRSGRSVASAGDVNGDGFADLIIGGPDADPTGAYSGASYVVFGKAAGFGANFNLSTLNGSNGFRLIGAEAQDRSGWSVASAGDFNGDGFDDVIVGAMKASATYIVYGKASGFTATIDFSTLNANTGLELAGAASEGTVGFSVAAAGDVNGDGYDDVIVGAPDADPHGPWSGTAYVVFGRASGISASLDLAALNGSNGFKLSGLSESDQAGFSVASAGDLNGDGFADLIVGALGNDGGIGASFVVFGKASGFSTNIDLSALNGTNGFRLNGSVSVASAGDFNGDGFADLIVGDPGDDTNGTMAGATYVMFGGASGFAASLDLSALNGDRGLRITGAVVGGASGASISSAGDVNGDGYDDLIISADRVSGGRGASYVVFGGALGGSTTPVTTTGTMAVEVLLGGRGNDVLTGGGGGDVFHAGAGNDRLTVKDLAFHLVDGGTGNDTLVLGGAGLSLDLANPLIATKLEGIERIDLTGSGNNTLIVSQLAVLGGIGSVAGGKHILVVERNVGDTVQFVEPNWTKVGLISNSDGTFERWVLGNAEVHIELDVGVSIVGTAGNDTISTTITVAGQPLATPLDDVIDGRGGADTMAGGQGDDTYVVDNVGDQVIEFAGGGTDLVRSSASAWTLGDNVENLILTGTASINGTGNGSNNVLTGNGGSNLLDGGAGTDTMAGGLSDDTYVVDVVGDVVTEGADEGTDTVNAWLGWTLGANLEQLRLMGTANLDGTGNALNNALFGNTGKNVLDGGLGTDTMTGGVGDDTYIIDNVGDVAIELAGEGIDTVLASIDWTLGFALEKLTLTGAANISGTGNELANALTGNAGNNVLDGREGADTMAGSLGNDTYVVDNAGDLVTEQAGEGTDTVLASISWTLGTALEWLTLTGVGNFNGTGNELVNVLTGNAGNNVLDGGAGADTMAGGLGDDTYVVDVAGDVVTEGAGQGTDTINAWLGWTLGATFEHLRLLGAADLDGTGNGLNNALFGNSGKNLLNGGAGADTMTGGLGDDTYMVDNAGDVVVEAAGAGIDLVQASVSFQLGANVEKLVLTGTGSINGTGNELANVLTGNGGKNVLDGGAGADTMAGGAGDDSYVVDNAGDVVSELAGGGIDTVLASVNWTLGAHLENLTLNGTAGLAGTGNELKNVLTGNAGANTLNGGLGADTMAGGLGNDVYVVDNAGDVVVEVEAAGIDLVRASVNYTLSAHVERLTLEGSADLRGTGNDLANVLTGNAGNNVLDGKAGADTMAGGLGDDTYIVDDAGDSLTEGAAAGIDTVQSSVAWRLRANFEKLTLTGTADIDGTGNELANVLAGNAGINLLDGGLGADTMAGGRGNDTYVVDDAGDLLVEGAGGGSDTVQASISYGLQENLENLLLTGKANLDGTGNAGSNTIIGNRGNNILDGGAGADRMEGGAGSDTYVVDHAGDLVVEAASSGDDEVQASLSYTLTANVERLTLTGTANLNGTGNELTNTLTGNAGDNLLDGRLGADTMAGGLGNDTYIVDSTGDVVTEAVDGGVDVVQASVTHRLRDNLETLVLTGSAAINGTGNALDNAIFGNGNNNVLDGAAGADTMEGGRGNDTYIVDDEADMIIEAAGWGSDLVQASISHTLAANVERLTLTGIGDTDGTGNGLTNTLTGNAGDNRLDGGLGADTMAGGLGDDTYLVDNAGDVVTEFGSGGIDTVLSSIGHTLRANVENLVLTGDAAVNGTGNALANALTGNGANNVLDGDAGADVMSGGEGDDTYMVDNAGDLVIELAHGGTDVVRSRVSHVLTADVENLMLAGKTNIDATGNGLANVLTGNVGRNVLDGGLGADVLAGGGGGDTFRFSTALGPDNVDCIVLFNHNVDAIQLDHTVFATLGTGALATGSFNLGVAATQADDRILFDTASKSLYYDADGLGGADAVRFATIDTLQGALDHTDFLIV